jgi:integrase/recombinase XerC
VVLVREAEKVLQFPSSNAVGPSIEAALGAYLRDCRVRDLSPHTVAGYEDVLGRFTRFTLDAGLVSLSHLTVDHARSWLESRGALAPVSKAGYVRVLRAWSVWCSGEYELGDRLARLRAPRVPERIPRLLSDDEIGAMLAAAPAQTRFAIILLWETGVRASEATGIDLADLSELGIIIRHPKGLRERIVPVSPALAAETRAYLADVRPAYAAAEEHALLIGRHGARLTREGLRQSLARVARVAGVSGANPHQWRRQFAHDWAFSGGPLFGLRDALGHRTLEMVSVYARTMPEDLARGVAAHSPLSSRGIKSRPRAASLRARRNPPTVS